jgi:hypothetical protein
VSFQSWWLRTRSSNQVNSNPEDLVLPQPIDASNCARAVTPTPSSTANNPPSFLPPGGTPAPVVSAVSLDHKTWRLGSAGMTISFRLSKPGKATLAFSRASGGRKVGRRCVAPTRPNRHNPRCTRQVSVGTFSVNAHAGLNRVPFQGRLSKHRTLRPGRYELRITATDAAGKRSTPRTASFTVLARR